MNTADQANQSKNETKPTIEKPLGELNIYDQQTAAYMKGQQKASLTGTTTLGYQSLNQIAEQVGTLKTRAKSKRQPKNASGIWIVEKSLDKKNWVPAAWMPTRQMAVTGAKASEEQSLRSASGIHYRVTRYEPSR